MSSSTIFYAIGDFMTNYAFLPFEWVGNIFNYALVVFGFVGLFYWLNMQKKYNQEAENNADQIK